MSESFLSIQETKILSKSDTYGIISFKIGDTPYLIHTYLQDEKWEPRTIYHKKIDFQYCPICQKIAVAPICTSAIERQKQILERLLKENNIRLRWIIGGIEEEK